MLRRFAFAAGPLVAVALAWAAGSGRYLYLRVYRYDPGLLSDRAIGYVPVDPAKPLPSGSGLRYVRVEGDLAAFTVPRLVQVLAQRHLTGVDLSQQREITDADLRVVAESLKLEFLNLAGTQVSDAGLGALAHLPLRRLALGASVTDAGLSDLAPLRMLVCLDLSQTRVTDSGLGHLAPLAHLETLLLPPRISNQGLLELADLDALTHNVRRLDLSGASVDDRTVGILTAFTHLEELALSGSPVGDLGIHRLTRLTRLKALELSDTAMTGEGLHELRALKRLEVLSISLAGGNITPADLRSLRNVRKLRLLIVNGRPIAGEQLSRLMSRLDNLPKGGAEDNSPEFLAQWGPPTPATGLQRLLGAASEPPGPMPQDAAFGPAG